MLVKRYWYSVVCTPEALVCFPQSGGRDDLRMLF